METSTRSFSWIVGTRAGHSDRNATIGSIREALRAGIYPAAIATSVRTTSIPTNVPGSLAVTPNSRLLVDSASSQDATDTDRHADSREPQCLHDDAALHIAGGGADGDPDPDLPRSLTHRVPDQPVDAERRQQQRERGKPAEQQHDEPSGRD